MIDLYSKLISQGCSIVLAFAFAHCVLLDVLTTFCVSRRRREI